MQQQHDRNSAQSFGQSSTSLGMGYPDNGTFNSGQWVNTMGGGSRTGSGGHEHGMGGGTGGFAKEMDTIYTDMLDEGSFTEDSSGTPASSDDDHIDRADRRGTGHDHGENSAKNKSIKASRAPLAPSGTSLRRGMACTFCRRRKLRCSGEKPICSMCIKYKQECTYIPPPKKPSKRKQQRPRAEQHGHNDKGRNAPRAPTTAMPAMPPLTTSELDGPYSHLVDGMGSTSAMPMSAHMASSEGMMSSSDLGLFSAGQFTFPPATATATGSAYLSHDGSYESTPANYMTNLQNQNWSNYDLNQQAQLSWQSSYPTPNASSSGTQIPSQAPLHLSATTPQPSFAHGFNSHTPTANASPHLYLPTPGDGSTTVREMSQAFGPSPFVDRDGDSVPYQQQLQSQHTPALPTHLPPLSTHTPNPAYRFPAQIHGSSRSSTPSEAPGSSKLAPNMPLRTSGDSQTQLHNLPYIDPDLALETQRVFTSRIDPIEGITERLGEFLFNPKEKPEPSADDDGRGIGVKRKSGGLQGSAPGQNASGSSGTFPEQDGLTDSVRDVLLDCFLAHSRLFFELSIPRFRYRLQFQDRRRPSLALLNAMYLWATRMSNSPNMVSMEQTFFDNACRALDLNSANGDRLIDCLRAAMLLSAWSFTSGRYHEGWILSGMAVRLVLSTGLHQIRSCVFSPEPPQNPFLRSKTHLLPPAEDSTELAERIHTFWAVYVVDRCGAAATGFPVGIRDQDITTPFPRPLADIISGAVSEQDDVSVRDIYRPAYLQPVDDIWYAKFCRSVTLLERATKLALLEPAEDSDFARQWSHHALNPGSSARPAAWLDQPKYRCPNDYRETRLGLEQMTTSMGAEGVFPIDRLKTAEMDGAEPPYISPKYIMLHHQFCATHMLLHDINSLECENKEALQGARRSVSLLRDGPQLPPAEVDSFTITVWCIVTKVLIKEMRRLYNSGDVGGMMAVEGEVNLFTNEMHKVGQYMQLARTQAKAMEEIRDSAKSPVRVPGEEVSSHSHLAHRGIKNLGGLSRGSRSSSDEQRTKEVPDRLVRMGGV